MAGYGAFTGRGIVGGECVKSWDGIIEVEPVFASVRDTRTELSQKE